MFKFLVCLVLTATVAVAIDLGESGLHFNHNAEYASSYDNYQPHDYQFNYAVSDPHTGDHKSQWEVKEKGVVRGGYSLLEPDGTTRVVEYIADDHGFRAVVKKIGTAVHPEHIETHGYHHVEPQAPVNIESPSVPAHVEEAPKLPVFQAYDGHVDNYAHVLGGVVQHLEPISYKQPVEIPHTIEYHGFHNHHNLHHENQLISHESRPLEHYQAQPQIAHPQLEGLYNPEILKGYYFEKPQIPNFAAIGPGHVETSVQYHGLTGNPDDDSSYTNYDEHHEQFGGEFAESIPKIISLSFNQQHIRPPLPYQFGSH